MNVLLRATGFTLGQLMLQILYLGKYSGSGGKKQLDFQFEMATCKKTQNTWLSTYRRKNVTSILAPWTFMMCPRLSPICCFFKIWIFFKKDSISCQSILTVSTAQWKQNTDQEVGTGMHTHSQPSKHTMHDVTCKRTRSHTRIMINKHTRDMIHETEIASGHHTTKQNKKRKRKEKKN